MFERPSSGSIMNPEWIRKNENPDLESMETAPSTEELPISFDILEINPGTPAELAGLQVGDEIIAIEGEDLKEVDMNLGDLVQTWDGSPISFTILRDGNEIELTIQPVMNEETGKWSIGLLYNSKLLLPSLEGYEDGEVKHFKIDLGWGDGSPIEGYIELASDGDLAESKEKMRLEIKKYVLVTENEDGSFSEYDLIERFNTTDTKIYFDPNMGEGKGAGVFRPNENEVVLSNPFSLLGPHILIHELRHADQKEGGRFKDLDKMYESVLNSDYDNDEYWDEMLQSPNAEMNLKKILSHIMDSEDAEKLISPLFEGLAELEKKWDESIDNIRDAAVGLHRAQLSRAEAEQKHESEFESLQRVVYRKHIMPLLDEQEFESLREVFDADNEEPLSVLMRAQAFNESGKIDEDSDEETIQEIYRVLRSRFMLDDMLKDSFLWNEVVLDDEDEGYCRVTHRSGRGFRMKISPQNAKLLEKAQESAREEYETEKEDAWKENVEPLKVEKDKAKKKYEEAIEIGNADRDALEKATKKLSSSTKLVGDITVRDVFRLTTLLKERDAEYGALVGLRAIKKETGIDLLTRLPPESEMIKKFIEKMDISERPDLFKELSERLDSLPEKETAIMSILSIRSIHDHLDQIGVSKGCLPALKQLRGSAKSESEGPELDAESVMNA